MTDHSQSIRPGWYLAVCEDCTPILPQPFRDPAERDGWKAAHETGTGHTVSAVDSAGEAAR